MFFQREGGGESANCLIFKFIDYRDYKKSTQTGKIPTSINVYFKDNFTVDTKAKVNEEKFVLIKAYAKKYGDYKVQSLNVSGKD